MAMRLHWIGRARAGRCAGALILSTAGLLAMAGPGTARADGDERILILRPGQGRIVRPDSTGGPLRLETGIEVVGDSVSIREVLEKAREGERRKFAGLETLAYTRHVRVVLSFGGKKPRTRVQDLVERVYFRAPDQWVRAAVRDTTWELDAAGVARAIPDDDEEKIRLSAGREGLDRIPYYLERLERFRFGDRPRTSLTDSTIVYEIEFRPASDFDDVPGGRIWLLTPGYQIVREEFEMNRLPFPWVLRSLDLVTREWAPVEDRWLERRIAGRARLGMNVFGLPEEAEFVVNFDDYRLNPELDPRLFDGGDR
jgi:hypothetical protein